MKTIEEKAKAYDEAIRKLRGMMPNWERLSYNGKTFLQDLIYIIPELAESEDEEIRKALLEMVHDTTGDELWACYNVHKEEALAWLEKQEGCELIRKEWLEHIKQSWYKEGFIDGKYSNKTPKEWTINDTTTLNELIDFLENGTAKLQHDLTRYANWLKIQFTPSEKQCEQKFEMKTAEESLGVDSDTYNKIVDECIFGEQKPEENKGNIGGISSNWSEEDEKFVHGLIRGLSAKRDIHGHTTFSSDCIDITETINWLQSLQDRVQPQPKYNFGDTELTQEELCEGLIRGMVDEHNRVTKEVLRNEYEKGRADAIAEMQKEWSDVDKDILFRIIDDLKFLRDTISIDPKYAVNIIDMEREITWLKSLRPQNRWKPSELQLECLSDAIKYYNSWGYPAPKLKELYEQLKKLKEGKV